MEKLDTSLAINASMEAGKKIMDAVQEEMDAVACFKNDDWLYLNLKVKNKLKNFYKI